MILLGEGNPPSIIHVPFLSEIVMNFEFKIDQKLMQKTLTKIFWVFFVWFFLNYKHITDNTILNTTYTNYNAYLHYSSYSLTVLSPFFYLLHTKPPFFGFHVEVCTYLCYALRGWGTDFPQKYDCEVCPVDGDFDCMSTMFPGWRI